MVAAARVRKPGKGRTVTQTGIPNRQAPLPIARPQKSRSASRPVQGSVSHGSGRASLYAFPETGRTHAYGLIFKTGRIRAPEVTRKTGRILPGGFILKASHIQTIGLACSTGRIHKANPIHKTSLIQAIGSIHTNYPKHP